MNPYLSRKEKENFVRLSLLEGLLDIIIEDYASTKRNDKQFMADLRRARTYSAKALNRRLSFLDLDAQRDLNMTMQRMELLFVPRNEVKRHYQEVAKLNSVVALESEDFNNWYEFLIEHACRTCERKDFKECKARQILMKYGIYAYNPAAVDLCQYSYIETEDQQQGVGVVGEALLKAKHKKGGAA